MPISEYRCGSCGSQFEFLVRHSSPVAECPACHSQDLEKLISLPAVSSEYTQKRSLRGAEQRTAIQRSDRAHEEHKAFHAHLHE